MVTALLLWPLAVVQLGPRLIHHTIRTLTKEMPVPQTGTEHRPEPWFWEAESEHCPHGPEPEDDTTDAWDTWHERHQWAPQDVRICLDAPMVDHCPECSADHNAPVAWADCPNNPAIKENATS